jgi:hypothetical protein
MRRGLLSPAGTVLTTPLTCILCMSCFVVESLSETVGGVRSAVLRPIYKSITDNSVANWGTTNSRI